MPIENNVNIKSYNPQILSNLKSNVQFMGNEHAVDKTPENDTVELSTGMNTSKKVGIGALVVTGLAITFGVLGRNGHLGESIQKFLKGAKKGGQNLADELSHTPKTETPKNKDVPNISGQSTNTEVKPEVPPKKEPKAPEPPVNAEVRQKSETKTKQDITPKEKANEKTEIKNEAKPTEKAGENLETPEKVKPKNESASQSRYLQKLEATQQAERELNELQTALPNMSRSELAKKRYKLCSYGGEIQQLKKKAEKYGLNEFEQIKYSSLNKQLELIRAREEEIEKSLSKFRPTTSKNSAVSMHHEINGENTFIRNAIESRANGLKGLDEEEVQNVLKMEKTIQAIDKEFAQLPPLEKDCIVYRGRNEHPLFKRFNTDFKLMDNAKVGDVIVPDTGYSYTAFDRSMAENWGGEGARCYNENGSLTRTLMYEIHLPKGAKVSRNLEHGGEVVMPRGAQYVIKDKKVDSEGCMEVVLDYILPKK